MAGGRPLKFETPEDLNTAAQGYFNEFLEGGINFGKPLTISGLAYSLDICTQTLINYTHRDEFFAPIKRLKQLIEITYEGKLHEHSCTGAIFALKNLGWKDKTESEVTGKDGAPLVSDVTAKMLALLTDEQLEKLNNSNVTNGA